MFNLNLITPEALEEVQLRDVLLGDPLFAGITSDPMEWELIDYDDDIKVFTVTYLGIELGDYLVETVNGSVYAKREV